MKNIDVLLRTATRYFHVPPFEEVKDVSNTMLAQCGNPWTASIRSIRMCYGEIIVTQDNFSSVNGMTHFQIEIDGKSIQIKQISNNTWEAKVLELYRKDLPTLFECVGKSFLETCVLCHSFLKRIPEQRQVGIVQDLC